VITSRLVSALIFHVAQTAFGFLQGGKPVDPTELEAFLDDYLVSNFATEADDESPYEVMSGRGRIVVMCKPLDFCGRCHT
jgi:hypothetical protein